MRNINSEPYTMKQKAYTGVSLKVHKHANVLLHLLYIWKFLYPVHCINLWFYNKGKMRKFSISIVLQK